MGTASAIQTVDCAFAYVDTIETGNRIIAEVDQNFTFDGVASSSGRSDCVDGQPRSHRVRLQERAERALSLRAPKTSHQRKSISRLQLAMEAREPKE